MKTAAITILILVFATISHAEIYKWRDANGRLHFADKPPEQAPSPVEEVHLFNQGTIETGRTAKPQSKKISSQNEKKLSEYEKEKKKYYERVNKVGEEAKRFRNENPDFAMDECQIALEEKALIQKKLKRSLGPHPAHQLDLASINRRIQVVCP